MGFDLRRYARQTNLRLLIGFIFLLFTLGEGLIWYFYGSGAALLGLLCLLAGLVPLILIYGILWVMERLVQSQRD